MLIVVSLLFSILLFLVIAIVIVVVYSLIQYVFDSIFLYKVGKKNDKKRLFSSWIPFYNKTLLGKVAQREVLGWVIFLLHLINIFLMIAFKFMYGNASNLLCDAVLVMIVIIVIVNFILNMVIFYTIMKKASIKYADFLLIFNVLTLGLFRSIILFMIRDNNNIMLGPKEE